MRSARGNLPSKTGQVRRARPQLDEAFHLLYLTKDFVAECPGENRNPSEDFYRLGKIIISYFSFSGMKFSLFVDSQQNAFLNFSIVNSQFTVTHISLETAQYFDCRSIGFALCNRKISFSNANFVKTTLAKYLDFDLQVINFNCC